MESLFLENVAQMGREIFRDIANKHEDGEFLPEVTAANPNLHRETKALLFTYCQLLAELGEVFMLHGHCQIKAKKKLSDLKTKLKANRYKENTLFWKTFNLEIGGDH